MMIADQEDYSIKFNYHPQDRDDRDYRILYDPSIPSELLSATSRNSAVKSIVALDWSPLFGFVYQQGHIGCCTACATNSLFCFVARKNRWIPSPLFTYFGSREMEGSTARDAGSSLRNSIKSLAKNGVCAEPTWPLTMPVSMRPSAIASQEATGNRAIQYVAVSVSVEQFRQALLNRHLIACGLPVHVSFLNAPGGNVPTPPTQRWDRLVGYHAVLIVGFDDAKQRFKFRNSWGTRWGQSGYGTIPYSMVSKCFDAWTILTVSTTVQSTNATIIRPNA